MAEPWRQGKVHAVERVGCSLDADALVLDHLMRLGCDPAQPRECRHYLYVRDEPGARTLVVTLVRDGWDGVYEKVDGVWLVTATIVTPLTGELVRETRNRLEALAQEFGGHYDGWEAAAD
ncbi:MAG: ribonuclease E inhibitor RraB [Actinomycetota bacterium]